MVWRFIAKRLCHTNLDLVDDIYSLFLNTYFHFDCCLNRTQEPLTYNVIVCTPAIFWKHNNNKNKANLINACYSRK
jgi:hypothetical protein